MRVGSSSYAAEPPEVLRWRKAFAQGNYAECVALGESLVRAHGAVCRSWQLLGLALSFSGQHARAVECLRKASRLNRADPSVWDHLGIALQRVRDHGGAASAFRNALRLAPASAPGWVNASCNEFEGGNAAEALRYAQRAIALDPHLPEAQVALGNALAGLGRRDEAIAALTQAVTLRPDFAAAHLSLGSALESAGRLADAVRHNSRAAQLAPHRVEPHINLGGLFSRLGDVASAIRHSRLAVDIAPACVTAWSNLLYALTHDESADPGEVVEAHFAFGWRIEAGVRDYWGEWENSRDPERKLKLGFVSGDFRDHPVARFIEPVWRLLDGSSFQIVAYSTCSASDTTTASLRGLADEWIDASHMSDDRLYELIRSQRIDVLFDLSGHTAGNRLGVFARKPAPLQTTWLGYPGTTGLKAIDFRFVDEWVAPPGWFEGAFSEELVYLPFANVFQPPAVLPPVVEAPVARNGYLTFGSFNRANKLTERTLSLWVQTLAAVPDAKLIVAAVPDGQVERRLADRFAAGGVAYDRVRYCRRLEMGDYLKLHGEVDIALDTMPFSSGTTANFAMWMGVPTLTLAGNVFTQRLCASRLAAAGLGEFIAESADDFVALAVHWSGQHEQLAQLRGAMRKRMTTNAEHQPAELTRAIERVLRERWGEYCRSGKGAPHAPAGR